MVLSSGYGQYWLHQCSEKAIQHQKTRGPTKATLNGDTNIHIPTFEKAATSKTHPKIPEPGLFNFASEGSKIDTERLPTVAECAAHLELLEAFYHIRLRVLSSTTLDAVLGIKPEPRTVYRTTKRGYRRGYSKRAVKLRDDTFQERRKAKWLFYLALATVRFLRWIEAAEMELHESEVSRGTLLNLPPIDVLMVWHAFLLNPSWYQRSKEHSLKYLHSVVFPWNEIHKAIDSDRWNWPYNPPEESITWFRQNTGLEANLFKALVKPKSQTVEQLLKLQGAPGRSDNALRSLTVQDVDAVLNHSDDLGKQDLTFLKCCRDAVSNDTKVTQLVDAVQRQTSFVDKMEKQLWIRSPAVEGTLHRAIHRYNNFLKLFKLYPKTMLVPTLDIDLVWHTHQCSPYLYEAGTVKRAGRLVDHDDKLGKGTLNTGFMKTKDLYRIRFAEDYQVCHCWDCEALLSAVTAQSLEIQMSSLVIAQHVHEDVAYHRSVEIARRNGETRLPIRMQKT